jgi:hypothetical protein
MPSTRNARSVIFCLLVVAIGMMMYCIYTTHQHSASAAAAHEGFATQQQQQQSLHHTAMPDGPAPLGYQMGQYDGLKLRTSCADGGWRHPPCTAPLVSATRNEVSTGHSLPLQLTPTLNDFPTAPPVNGTPGDSPRSDFMFAYNRSSPLCCPSTYSTSTGCVCTTPEQRNWLQQRGHNNTRNPSDL